MVDGTSRRVCGTGGFQGKDAQRKIRCDWQHFFAISSRSLSHFTNHCDWCCQRGATGLCLYVGFFLFLHCILVCACVWVSERACVCACVRMCVSVSVETDTDCWWCRDYVKTFFHDSKLHKLFHLQLTLKNKCTINQGLQCVYTWMQKDHIHPLKSLCSLCPSLVDYENTSITKLIENMSSGILLKKGERRYIKTTNHNKNTECIQEWILKSLRLNT